MATAKDDHKLDDFDGSNPVTKSLSYQVGELEELSKTRDPALLALGHATIEYNPEEGRSVLRKIDLHLLPMLTWVYMIQFADKTSLNYASVMGVREDTHLDPNSDQFSWVSSIFYTGYIA